MSEADSGCPCDLLTIDLSLSRFLKRSDEFIPKKDTP